MVHSRSYRMLLLSALFSIAAAISPGLCRAGTYAAEPPVAIAEADTIATVTEAVDTVTAVSVEADGMRMDTTAVDTLRRELFTEPDTATVRGGVLTLSSERLLDEMYRQMQDSAKVKKVRPVVPVESQTAKERSRLFKDSLSFSTVSAVSFVLPGFGQLYNRQAWKIPVLYGTVGGFATGAALLGKQYRKYDNRYNDAVYNKLPSEQIDALHRKANKYKTERTLCIAGAAVSYLYFVGDAALNYKGAVHDTRKATVLSAIFPGAGQIYNKSYWKLPIVWGGMAAFGYIIDYNNRGYQRFKNAYNALTDGDPNTVDEFQGRYDASFLQNTRDSYRRYRDLGIMMMSGFYLLSIIDALRYKRQPVHEG